MAVQSSIEWTGSTWNPVTGCTRISAGCQNCYAERMARRLQAMGQIHYAKGFAVACHAQALDLPLRWKTPRMIFVNSMSDLFHDAIPLAFLQKVFRVMRQADQHIFQVLTKRAERLAELAPILDWPENTWAGVTVERSDYKWRIDFLRTSGAPVKFISAEPLLDSLGELDLREIDWVIAGGESGPRARPVRVEWVRAIRDQCLQQRVPFFFKQWGGFRKKKAGRTLDGRIWDQMPEPVARGIAGIL
jgi:protein gp37